MDMNYILGREQVSLRRATTAKSSSARFAHLALAKAYGCLLAASRFPHNPFQREQQRQALREEMKLGQEKIGAWEAEGGRPD